MLEFLSVHIVWKYWFKKIKNGVSLQLNIYGAMGSIDGWGSIDGCLLVELPALVLVYPLSKQD